MAVRHKDIIGQRFRRWLVIRRAGRDKFRRALWLCRCDCGAEQEVAGISLRAGNSMSCGCINRTHGYYKSRTWQAWIGMRERCQQPGHNRYESYAGRGITVCERWQSFESFLADMGEAPSDYTLERIDNDGDYEPGNCRWASVKEQARNRRTTRWVEYNRERLSLAEHCERARVPYKWAWEQIVKRGRAPEQVFERRQ